MYLAVPFYRVVCFRKPRGPWRLTREQAQRDAADEGLGSFDEWGAFYATVPGDIEVMTLPTRLLEDAVELARGRAAA
jgi:hypothetical protein